MLNQKRNTQTKKTKQTAPEAFVHAVGQLIEAWGPIVERGLGLPGEAAAIALLLDAGGCVCLSARSVLVHSASRILC